MSSPVKILPHYTYLDYIKWEGQWELIDGIPYAMSPLPRLRHQEVSGNIYSEFKAALKAKGCNCKAFLPVDYKVSEDTVLQPDVLVICNPDMDQKNLEKAPQLVVEVLSPSTVLKDRNSKFFIYEEERIPYYLIVDTEKEEIEIYRLAADGKYQLEKITTDQPYPFIFEEGCTVDIVLNNIWE